MPLARRTARRGSRRLVLRVIVRARQRALARNGGQGIWSGPNSMVRAFYLPVYLSAAFSADSRPDPGAQEERVVG